MALKAPVGLKSERLILFHSTAAIFHREKREPHPAFLKCLEEGQAFATAGVRSRNPPLRRIDMTGHTDLWNGLSKDSAQVLICDLQEQIVARSSARNSVPSNARRVLAQRLWTMLCHR